MLENKFIEIDNGTDVENNITKTKRTYNKRTLTAFTYNDYVTDYIQLDISFTHFIHLSLLFSI